MSIFQRTAKLATTVAAAVCVVAVAGSAAQAASRSCTSSTDFTLANATDAECFTGNDTNQIDDSFEMFSMTGWILADKNDDNSSGDQSIVFTDAPANGTKSGDWTISALAEFVVITLKAGNGFGAFLLDQQFGQSGTWSAGKDLSHASIYYKGDAPSPVPLPAAGFLLLGGIGGLGLASRRRRKES